MQENVGYGKRRINVELELRALKDRARSDKEIVLLSPPVQ